MSLIQPHTLRSDNCPRPLYRSFSTIACRVSIAFALLLPANIASGQDTVIMFGSEPGSTIKRKGTIVQWIGPELTIDLSGTSKSIPNDQIVGLETTWSPEYQQAKELLAARKIAAAFEPLRIAIAGEQREWASAIIRADLMRCLSAGGADFDACQLYLQLLAKDPETRFAEFIPLAWESGMVDGPFAESAKRWMNANDPMAQILGASWLFGTSDRSAAITKLKELSRDIRPAVAHLASAQVWRSEMLSADTAQVDRWALQVKRMPKSLQAGPLLMLGLANERLGRREECLTALLQIPILHQDDYRLSATALHRAALILQNAGQSREARRLWNEVVASFPETKWSQTARDALTQTDPKNQQ